jgi:hypothetical protein
MTKKAAGILKARLSSRIAGELLRKIVPERFLSDVLNAVAHSIRVAHRATPSKWGLRLNRNSIMLKVGFVEVLQVGKAIDFVSGLGNSWFHELVYHDLVPPKVRADRRLLFTESPYSNVRSCDTCDTDLLRLPSVYSALRPAHEAAIRIASVSPRRPDTVKDHSPGLVAFILGELGVRIIQPSYFPQDDDMGPRFPKRYCRRWNSEKALPSEWKSIGTSAIRSRGSIVYSITARHVRPAEDRSRINMDHKLSASFTSII